MTDRFISVCVLSYERLEFLRDSLASMVAGAREPVEIIVHDDGSRDEGLRSYLVDLLDSGWISRLILNAPGHNEGQGIALNRMFHMAKGDIIVKADQDLIYRPGWTTAIREVMDATSDLGIDPDAPPRVGALGLFKYHHEPVRHTDMHIARRWNLQWGWDEVIDFCGSLIAMPRKAWEVFGPWDERSSAFAEDAVMKQRITDNPAWCCALTMEDWVENIGFGVGRSTLVKGFDSNNEGILAEIHDGPRLVEMPVHA